MTALCLCSKKERLSLLLKPILKYNSFTDFILEISAASWFFFLKIWKEGENCSRLIVFSSILPWYSYLKQDTFELSECMSYFVSEFVCGFLLHAVMLPFHFFGFYFFPWLKHKMSLERFNSVLKFLYKSILSPRALIAQSKALSDFTVSFRLVWCLLTVPSSSS